MKPYVHKALDRLGLVKTYCGAEAKIFNFTRNWASVTCPECLRSFK